MVAAMRSTIVSGFSNGAAFGCALREDSMAKFGVGQPVKRVEDQRLITGHGRYTDDINMDGQAYGFVLRSPHAHAKIISIDTSLSNLPSSTR